MAAELRHADTMLTQGRGVDDGGAAAPAKKKSRSNRDLAAIKRRCVSTACVACRKRKSKCDGQTPRCAAVRSSFINLHGRRRALLWEGKEARRRGSPLCQTSLSIS